MYLQEEFENVCCNIRWLRTHYGLSRSAMARKLRITVKSLDALESGVIPQRLRIHFLFCAHQAFGVSMEQLFKTRLKEDT